MSACFAFMPTTFMYASSIYAYSGRKYVTSDHDDIGPRCVPANFSVKCKFLSMYIMYRQVSCFM